MDNRGADQKFLPEPRCKSALLLPRRVGYIKFEKMCTPGKMFLRRAMIEVLLPAGKSKGSEIADSLRNLCFLRGD